MTKQRWAVVAGVAWLAFAGCGGASMHEDTGTDAGMPAESFDASMVETVSQKVIYFGHHSVGSNILEGLVEVVGGLAGTGLNVVEGTDIGNAPGIYHSRVGQNRDPLSKFDGFERVIENGVGNRADVAFFKLCYVDIGPQTDVAVLFRRYEDMMARLETNYPKTRFVHVTTPLTTRERGIKTLAKGLIGRPRRGYEDNLVRERYNRLLRDRYGSQGLVFDLARVESTLPDGARLDYMLKGQTYYALAPEYTSDGGHLNESGRRRAAAELLRFLASVE